MDEIHRGSNLREVAQLLLRILEAVERGQFIAAGPMIAHRQGALAVSETLDQQTDSRGRARHPDTA